MGLPRTSVMTLSGRRVNRSPVAVRVAVATMRERSSEAKALAVIVIVSASGFGRGAAGTKNLARRARRLPVSFAARIAGESMNVATRASRTRIARGAQQFESVAEATSSTEPLYNKLPAVKVPPVGERAALR